MHEGTGYPGNSNPMGMTIQENMYAVLKRGVRNILKSWIPLLKS